MAMGAYQTSKLGPVCTHATNSMRRKPIIIALAFVVVLALFYIPHSPEALSYANIKIPSSFTDAITTKSSSEPGFPKAFPKKIWQAGSQSMKEEWAKQTKTWISMNSKWNYELLTDDSNTIFVEDSFQDQPEVLAFWRDFNVTALRPDFVRHLIMLADGGVYSDLDTSCMKLIEEWIPSYLDESTINAVIGVEYDDNTDQKFVRPVSFSQRTMMAKPGHPIFKTVVAQVMLHLGDLSRDQDTDVAGSEVGEKEVMKVTGSTCFTDAVMENLGNTLGRKVEWSDVQGLKEPTLFGDVLILSINGFGSGQNHSHSSDPAYGEILVKHHADAVESIALTAADVAIDEKTKVEVPVLEPTGTDSVEESDLSYQAENDTNEAETETQGDDTPV
ncbi:hypothetical protein DL95DRAFT_384551 [Leptodontidium sp. 2 PMI_412]|nr:hypothetical protein DL95DRAFT_384551 [Leptodontidium sp. 2 PMI_412]